MSELVDLQKYQRERDRIIAEFELKIANLEAQIITLEQEIVDAEEQISLWSIEVENLQIQLLTWRGRKETADFLYDALVRNYKWEIDQACNDFNLAWSGYAQVERVATLWLDYVKIWIPLGTLKHSQARSIEVKDILVSEANQQITTADSNLIEGRNALWASQNTLEAKTRHMRDLQLAKEGAEEEKRGALALWETDYQAAQERRRIEVASIARDISLGYPAMEAQEARTIAETAYGDALARGFTRLADVIQIATNLAEEWWNREVYPHLITTRINCPSCAAELELTVSDIAGHNRDLLCPQCANYIAEGFSVRWVFEPVVTYPCPYCGAIFSSEAELNAHIAEAHPGLPIAGIGEWLGKYWPILAFGGIGTSIIAGFALRKKK